MNNYLQAIRSNARTSLKLLPRVFWLLLMENTGSNLSTMFQKHVEVLPAWIWLENIPLLLFNLNHRNGHFMQGPLMKLAACYPQAIYFYLRSFVEDSADSMDLSPPAIPRTASSSAAAKPGSASTPTATVVQTKASPAMIPPSRPQTPVQMVKSIMSRMKGAHTRIVDILERLVFSYCAVLQ